MLEIPRFDGTDPENWIFKIEYYFDYFMTPEEERLPYMIILLDHLAAKWIRSYVANNNQVTWREFLDAVRKRFDPEYYSNYLGTLAKLQQTGSVMDYQAAFEDLLERVVGVPEFTLESLFASDLKQLIQSELNMRRPTTLADAFALARELSARTQPSTTQQIAFQRRGWQQREQHYGGPAMTVVSGPAAAHPAQPNSSDPTRPPPNCSSDSSTARIPIIRVSSAEKADHSRRGLCWYCDERWAPNHQCKQHFLAYMGADDDEDDGMADEQIQDEAEVITGDVSHVLSLEGKPGSGAIKLMGSIGTIDVHVLVDIGASQNFLHPSVAEKLCLPLHMIKPFRIYVGNGKSLICSYVSRRTKLILQGILFEVDLHILPIHELDVTLGMEWLSSLGRVTHDYVSLTMDFYKGDQQI